MDQNSNQQAFLDLILKLADGNFGALSVLKQVMTRHNPHDAAMTAKALLAQGCVGPDLWLRYKDECGENVEKFMLHTVFRHAD